MGLEQLLNQGKDIVNGHVNELLGLNKDISQERMKICKTCPLYKPSFGGICNHNLWLDPQTLDISNKAKTGYIRGCGCMLTKKTRLPYASCPANRW